MDPLHRTSPHSAKGQGYLRTLKIKGPMIGHSIHSNNHIRRGNCIEADSVATKTISKVDVELENIIIYPSSCLRADEVPEKGMKNIYSYAKLILMQKKDSHMVHDDIREEYFQSSKE